VFISKTTLALALVAVGCASAQRVAPKSPFADYRRFFLTMPSHYAGFGMTSAPATVGGDSGADSAGSSRNAVDRAFVALQGELTDAGFDVVARDQDADAVLEITMGGMRPDGEADRAFIAFRDAGSGRLMATFGAEARAEHVTVEQLMARIAASIERTVD
jgi:hypothetical protein